MASPQITVDIVHEKVHEGVSYTANYLEKSLVNSGYMRILFRTGVKSAHLIIEVEAEGKLYFRTFSSPTFSDAGTLPGTTTSDKLTLFNRRGGADGASTTVTHTPTITLFGDMRGNRVFPFGTGGTAVGGQSASRVESVISANSVLLIEVQNVSGQVRDIGIVLDWYEVSR